MMRSMYSGVSGLRVHQTKMDVIGNNIANVNTIGFKSSTVAFSDILYQTTQSASGPNAATGNAGRNAMQIGLGSNVASITASIATSGAAQRTDNPFDIMIEGDGFFVVNDGGSNYFTKAGSFQVDAYGTLATSSGARVMGWGVDPEDPTKTIASDVQPLQIMSAENMFSAPAATKAAYVAGNIDSKDTQLTSASGKAFNIPFYDKMGHAYTANFKVTRPGTETNQYSITVTDIKNEKGDSIFVNKIETIEDDGSVTVTYEQTAITEFAFGDATYTVEEPDEDTGAVTLTPGADNLILFDGATGAFTRVGADAVADDENTNTLNLTIEAEPNPFESIAIDFSKLTMYSTSGNSTIEGARGDLEGKDAGKKVGNMTGVSVDVAGKIYGKYDNGDSKLLGQIVVATFANPSGLEAVGNNMFAATLNSGEFNGIGEDPTLGGGSLNTGVVEMSNVDLAAQFTEMITTQRGFQANSRIITTSDSLLEELINLKR